MSIRRACSCTSVNVVYAVNGLDAWPAVASTLFDRIDWDPVYWISPPILEGPVIRRFPNIPFHTHYDAHRGIRPDNCPINQVNALDAADYENYSGYLNTALRLMDRMEVRDSFHFDERVHHFYRQLAYWTTVVEHIDPDWAVFDSSPHLIAHYILYAVCNQNDISTVFMTPTGLPETIIARSSIHKMPYRIESNYKKQSSICDVPDRYKTHLEKIRDSDYEDAKPSYMETESTDWKGYQVLRKFRKYLRYAYYTITERPTTYLKPPNGSVDEELTYPQYIVYRKFAKRRRQSLERKYNKISKSANLDEDYVYVPLHYQPERTSVPEGGVYGDQYLMVDLLSDVIPPNWKLYIKEHPAQFESGRAHQGRWPRCYRRLQEIEGVQLINFSNNSFELIDNSQAVATLTGTAGWEAVVRGTPALVFGNAWYRQSPGVYDIKSREETRWAVERIREGREHSKDDIDAFVAAVHQAGQRGYLSPNLSVANEISTETNVEGITQAIINEVSAHR